MLKIGVIRGIAKKSEILSGKLNIYTGISLNNKWCNKENINAYILWGSEHTKEKFGIVIADTLHAINYEVRSNYSSQAAIRKALHEGDKFLKIISEILEELTEDQRNKIEIIRWEDVRKDQYYKKVSPFFLQEFKTNSLFKKDIRDIVRGFVSKLDQPKTSEEKIERLCLYVIDEFPELMNGFTHKGIHYTCHIYPSDAELLRLIEKIQKREIYAEFHEKNKIGNNVFLELHK